MLRNCKTVKGSGGGKPSLSGKRKPPSTAAKERAKKARRKARAARTAGAAEIDAAAALLSVSEGGSRGVAGGSERREDVAAPWADREHAPEPVMSDVTNSREYSDNSCATNVTSAVTETQDSATNRTPNVTVQFVTASHETPATDQEAGATDQDTAVLSELNYWYIYDQNYGRERLTVKSDYVSTKQTWNIARIIQRKPCRSGFMYRVLWCRKKSVGGRYYQRTWEPGRVLLEGIGRDFRGFALSIKNIPSS